MSLKDKYIAYISGIRRYSRRTQEIYAAVLDEFIGYCAESAEDESVIKALVPDSIRNYEVYLLDNKNESPRTVNLHLSALSGFCRFLLKEGIISSNPLKQVPRPKSSKRLPVVYRKDSMKEYFSQTECFGNEENADLIIGNDKTSLGLWCKRRDRLVMRLLYDTGMRRSELIGLSVSSVDFSRSVIHVLGKGNKMREIPLLNALSEEILLYLHTTARILGCERLPSDPLLVTEKGKRLYPMAVQRIVEAQLATVGVTGRKSPHALRHTLATELLDEGADLNSIKELLGHSSLAATQVYTHTSVEKLKQSYINAHPRAKRGG